MLIGYLSKRNEWPIISNIIGKVRQYIDPGYCGAKWPLFLTLFITDNCNTTCDHCWRPGKSEKNYISLSEVQRVASVNVPIILISGGEPTIHPDFYAIINTLYNRSSKMYILTNGFRVEPLISASEGKRNIRILIPFLVGQIKSLTNRKLQTIAQLRDRNIKVHANLVVDVDSDYPESLSSDDLERVCASVDRAYVTKYLRGNCSISKDHIARLGALARYISFKYHIETVTTRFPNALERFALSAISTIVYQRPYTLCSGYPLKASLNEHGDLSDCPRIALLDESFNSLRIKNG